MPCILHKYHIDNMSSVITFLNAKKVETDNFINSRLISRYTVTKNITIPLFHAVEGL